MTNYDDCFKENNIWFCKRKGVLIVGNNKTEEYQNAVVTQPIQNKIVIPVSIRGEKIRELGSYSFSNCTTLTHVNIQARIYQINQEAFWQCKRLEEIRIPSTCIFIFQWGIQTHDPSLGTSAINTYKTLNIIFESRSRLKFLDDHAISYRENVNIFFCNKVEPEFHERALFRTTNVRVYSPSSFVFHGNNTIPFSYTEHCYSRQTCKIQKRSPTNILSMIFLLYK